MALPKKSSKKLVAVPEWTMSRRQDQRKLLWMGFGFLLFLVITLLALFLWLYYGNLEESISGTGQLKPYGKIREIRAPERGIVSKIFVKANDTVKAGQVLMELDPELAEIYQDTLQEQVGLTRQEVRALRLAHQSTIEDDTLRGMVSGTQGKWLRATRQRMKSQLVAADMAIQRATHDLQQAKEVYAQSKEVLASQEKQLMLYQELYNEGGYSLRDLTDYQEQVLEQRGRVAAQKEQIQSRTYALEEAKGRPAEIEQVYQEEILERLTRLEKELVRFSGEHAQAKVSTQRQIITAPVDGTVLEQVVHGAGDVVPAGETLMTLVPKNSDLIAEVQVTNQDMVYVHLDQPAKLMLEALPMYQFGKLEGTVVGISPSTVMDAEGRPNYLVQIRPSRNYMEKEGKQYPLKSGMTVTADMITREKSILSFFTEPLQFRVERAFHDPSNR